MLSQSGAVSKAWTGLDGATCEDATAAAPRRPSATTAARILGVARRVVVDASAISGWPSSGSSVEGFMLFKVAREVWACEAARRGA